MNKKMLKSLTVIIVVFLVMMEARSVQAATKGYQYKNNGVSVAMHDSAEKFIKKAGKPIKTKVKKSCAYEGKDRTYTYKNFILYTYSNSNNGPEFVNGVTFLNNKAKTMEGIKIGSTYKQMVKAYGKTKDNFGIYTYEKGKSRLQIEIEDDEVKNIRYVAVK